MIPSRFFKDDVALRAVERKDAHLISEIHKTSFDPFWSEEEILDLLRQNTVYGYLALDLERSKDKHHGFVLFRIAADEAEILTIAVHPRARNRGIGYKLGDAAMRKLYKERIAKLFLEVDQTNRPALKLYKNLGFKQVGERKEYYHKQNGTISSALVMQRVIR